MLNASTQSIAESAWLWYKRLNLRFAVVGWLTTERSEAHMEMQTLRLAEGPSA